MLRMKPTDRPVTRGRGRAWPFWKIIRPSWKNVLDIV